MNVMRSFQYLLCLPRCLRHELLYVSISPSFIRINNLNANLQTSIFFLYRVFEKTDWNIKMNPFDSWLEYSSRGTLSMGPQCRSKKSTFASIQYLRLDAMQDSFSLSNWYEGVVRWGPISWQHSSKKLHNETGEGGWRWGHSPWQHQ